MIFPKRSIAQMSCGVVSVHRQTKRACFVVVYVLFLLLLGECGARAFWVTRDVPFFTAQRGIYRSFYPGVAGIERSARTAENADDAFDVLILGGSVLNPRYGDVEHVLRERLTRATDKRVRVYNLAEPAHTSLDSYYKYKHLSPIHFDVVLVYHGINELRANNCPPDTFREDYSHFSWYRLINDFERRADSRWFVLPYTIEFVALKAAGRLGWSGFLPTHDPDPASLAYGCDVKTKASFQRNLRGIVETAQRRREPVVLMSFAYYLPDDYTENAFQSRQLDYTIHTFPVELWGKPECVAKGLRVHDEVVAELARTTPGVKFVDQDGLIPHDRQHFNDICHLTHEGCERFVENLVDVILVAR